MSGQVLQWSRVLCCGIQHLRGLLLSGHFCLLIHFKWHFGYDRFDATWSICAASWSLNPVVLLIASLQARFINSCLFQNIHFCHQRWVTDKNGANKLGLMSLVFAAGCSGEVTECMGSTARVTVVGCLLEEKGINYTNLHMNDANCTGRKDEQDHRVTFIFDSSDTCGAVITVGLVLSASLVCPSFIHLGIFLWVHLQPSCLWSAW